MKKAFYSLAVLLCFASIIGCNKHDDNNATIVGKWTFTKANIQFVVLGTSQDSTITGNSNTTIEYKSDGTAVSVDSTGQTESYTYSYNSSTKVLTETNTDTTVSYNVVMLTSSDLQLHNEGTEDYFGYPVTYKADLYFKR